MARSVTLTTLISDVRTKGDFAGATVRHTDAQITRLLNQSIQRFRDRISDEGSEHYLVSSSGTLGVGPTSPYPFYQLDLSALSPAMVRPYGVDVTFPGGDVKTLDRVPFEMRAKYGTTQQGGTPQAWAPFKDGQLAILPASSTAYAYTVWYLPVLADLSSGSDTFDGVAGWEDFIVWDVVCQLIARDQFPQAYGIAVAQRDSVWEDIKRGAVRVTQAGGAHLGRDSFGGKLPLFLGDRRPTKTAAGGPIVPATGSVTDAMLADMTGPTVKGVLSGTTRPYSIGVATLTTYLSQFSTTQRGLVPPPLSVGSRYLDDSGNWSLPAGGGAGGSVGPSGAVQFQAGTGMAGASGFRVHGNSPSLLLRLDGSFRLTGGQLEVGSGTVRVSASGVDVGGGSVINVGTLVASAIAGPAVTDTVAGLAPASGGGTSNFLRADGTWAAPPGTAGSPGGTYSSSGNTPGGSVQYITASGTFGGTTLNRVRVQELSGQGGVALGFGGFAPSAVGGTIAVSDNFYLHGYGASGGSLPFLNWRDAGSAGNSVSGAAVYYGNSSNAGLGVQANVFRTASGGFHLWQMGGSGLGVMRLMPTGLDASAFHVAAKSLRVSSGIPNTELSPMASGTIKGQLGADATPNDIPIASLTTALYPFDSSNRGVVPGSGGGSANFLRADGTWAVPPGTGGTSSPGGGTSNIQFRDAAGTFGGASGILAVASGSALQLGGPTAASVGWLRGGQTMSVYGMHPSLTDVRMLGMGTGTVELGQSGIAAKVYGDFSAQNLTLASGLADSSLAPMGSGTVKGRLTGTGTPSDISIPTLHAFAPTFTSTQPGTVPGSGGGTSNFLRADGTWAAPPGGASSAVGPVGAVQVNDGVGGFFAASGIRISGSGSVPNIPQQSANPAVLNFGAPYNGSTGAGAGFGSVRAAGYFSIYGTTPSAVAVSVLEYRPTGLATVGATGGAALFLGEATTDRLHVNYQAVGSGGKFQWDIGALSPAMRLSASSGLDISALRLYAGSANVSGDISAQAIILASGIGNSGLQPMGSGTIKGNLTGTGAPSDVPFATFMAFAPTFTATRMGVTPASGGGSTNYLRADGTWAAPPGTAGNPAGGDTALQFYQAGSFGGATGLNAVGNGQALGFGVPSFLPGAGDIRVASGFNITGNLPSGIAGVTARQNLFDWSGGGGSGTLKVGGASGVLGTLRSEVATGGAFEWLIGGQTGASLRPTGLDLTGFNIKAKSLDIGSINGLPFDLNGLKRFPSDLITNLQTGLPSGLRLYAPRGAASGGNRFSIPSGAVPAARTITLQPTGARAGETIRVERNGTENFAVTIADPTGTTLHIMPSGTKSWADFQYTKPSGPNFTLAGHADMF